MKIQRTMAIMIASAALTAVGAQAQVSTQELYSVKFHATATGDSSQGNGKKTKITETDLINAAVGSDLSKRDAKRNYELVYNPATDSIQVVNEADGSLVSDVFLFEGGTNVIVGDELQRFTFVFSPTESEAIGSAVIKERSNNNNNRAHIIGDIQFTLPTGFAINTGLTPTPPSSTDSSGTSTSTDAILPGSDTNSMPTTTNSDGTVTSSDTGTTVDTGGNVDTSGFVQASAAATATNSGVVRIATGTFIANRIFQPGEKGKHNNNNNNNDNGGGSGTNFDTGATSGTDTNANNSVNSTNSTRDIQFVQNAAQSGLTEVQLAQLALQNSTNQTVLDYAQQMIQDHTQANLQLTELAAGKGIDVPTTLSIANQQTVNRLAVLEGSNFDRAYRTEAVSSHRLAIQQFKTEASKGDDAEIQTFAQSQIAVLQQHLTSALQLP